MIVRTTVHGAAARKYAGYTYRKAILQRIDIWQLDPDRLHPANEFPRFVNSPSQPLTKTVDLADCEVRFVRKNQEGRSRVQVWMMPNQYTDANEPSLVCELFVANEFKFRDRYVDKALSLVFA